MDPLGILLGFLSFWSISAVGVYLTVTGIGHLRMTPVRASGAGRRGIEEPRGRVFAQLRGAALLGLGVLLLLDGLLLSYVVTFVS